MAHALALEENIVIDDPDDVVSFPVRSRTSTDGALTMQVRIDGEWHRRIPSLSHTSCALAITGQFNDLRRETLADRLCAICFTPFERSQVPKEDR